MKNCPICGKPAQDSFTPFCSPRCADIDLHHWLGETYRVPVHPDADEDGEVLANDNKGV